MQTYIFKRHLMMIFMMARNTNHIYQRNSIKLIIYRSYLMQQVKQKIFDHLHPKCSGNNQTFFACIQQTCHHSAFMCSNVLCVCSDNHKKCIISRISNIFESIQDQKQPIDQQTQKAFQAIEKIYDDAIEKLSKERTQFLQAIPYFGVKAQSLKFIFQLQSDPEEINGETMSKLYKELQIMDLQVKIKTIKQIQVRRPQIQQQVERLITMIGNFTFKEKKNFDIQSKILKKKQQNILLQMLCNVKDLSLLYRASQNNFSANKFRLLTNNETHTLTIAQTQTGKIIGGYTPLKWQNSNTLINCQDAQKQSFLFSITQRQKYSIKDPAKAIVNYKNLGPCFGTDLKISDNCNIGLNCETDFPFYYSNTKNQAKPKSYRSFTGGQKFNVKEYEVFKVHFHEKNQKKVKEQNKVTNQQYIYWSSKLAQLQESHQ